MKEYESFVFYGSWRETLEAMVEEKGVEYAQEALWNLMTCATAGDVSTKSKMIMGWINGSCIPNISAARGRYQRAKENGAKGGRPIEVQVGKILELKEQGKTNREIADVLGCSERSIERANQKNRQNLDKEKEKEKDKEKENYGCRLSGAFANDDEEDDELEIKREVIDLYEANKDMPYEELISEIAEEYSCLREDDVRYIINEYNEI